MKIVIDLSSTGYEPGDADDVRKEVIQRLAPMGIWRSDVTVELPAK